MADEERSEPFEQLEQRVNRRVQEALSGLQQEIRDRLKRAGDHLVGELDRELGDVASGLPSSFLPREELEPLTAEAEDAGRRQLLGHLLAALSAVDGAASQRAILAALAHEGLRFADRTAVLLTRDDGYHLWGADGWGSETPSDVSLPWGDAGPWAAGTVGSGAAVLTANDCAPLCSRLDGALPAGGVLVPLILRDRLAAVVYADHDGGAFFAEALQALTWAAALALEALPFRDREATPTLHLAGAAAPAAVFAAPPADEAAEVELEIDEPELPELDEGEIEIVDTGEAAEFELEDEPAVALADDELSEIEIAAEEVELSELEGEIEGGDVEVELADGDDEDWSLEEPSADVGELEISEPEDGEETLPEPPTWEAPTLDAPELDAPADEVELDEFDDAVDGDLYTGDAAPEDAGDEPSAAAAPAAGEVETEQVPRIAGFERAHTEPALGEEAGGAEPPAAETAAPADGSPQVAPPSGHQGPGLAFGAERTDGAEGDGARHEEARRLARLLVSEIRLYNEDLVEEGRRNQDIYQRLKEDIDRSRQIYEERIDAGLREDTDYFYEELVRNLGGGDAQALGI